MPDSTVAISVSTSWPSEPDAQRAAGVLVSERLAACAQVSGPIRSTYWWQGKVEEAVEWSCLLKTTQARLPGLERRLRALHSYQVPEIVATSIVGGSADYLTWIQECVR